MQEKQLKERIESLEPLSVGVAFGKEDAWDKLQARLDAKPKRKWLPIYWQAAAIVFITVAIALVFKQQTHNSTKTIVVTQQQNQPTEDKTITTDIPNTTAPATAATTTQETPVTMKTTIAAQKPTVQKIHPVPIERITIVESKEEPVAGVPANVSVPVVVVKQPMKVVHINELDNAHYPHNNATAANDAPTTDITKMQVVHINKVLKEESQPYYRVLENKNPINLFTFIKPKHQTNYTFALGH